MGSMSAMSSIERVLERHGDSLRAELLKQAKSGLVKDVVLGNNVYEIDVVYVLADGTELEGRPIDIDELAGWFPDEVGY